MACKFVHVVRFVSKLPGGCQAILVEATDGKLYALKFKNNPQGGDVFSNEVAGIQLYKECRLPTPSWKAIYISDHFLERNRACWIEGAEGPIRPQAGLTFATRYLQTADHRIFQILPSAYFSRVNNRSMFWFAWIVDTCSGLTDTRQAVFLEQADRTLDAFFIDFGNQFGAQNTRSRLGMSSYLDYRIYPELTSAQVQGILNTLASLDYDAMLRVVIQMPKDWKSGAIMPNFVAALHFLADRSKVQSVIENLVRIQEKRTFAESNRVANASPFVHSRI